MNIEGSTWNVRTGPNVRSSRLTKVTVSSSDDGRVDDTTIHWHTLIAHVHDGILTKAFPLQALAIGGTVGVVDTVAGRVPPCGATALGTRAWWVGTTVLAVGNAEVGVVGLVLDTVNGLDRVRDVSEVDECAVPAIRKRGSATKV